jgi:hypothetical protein
LRAREKVKEYQEKYGVEVLNLVIERHNLSTEKRNWFSVRFVSEDPEFEKECTQKMDELDKKIYKIDSQLLLHFGIDKNLRTQMIRAIKKAYPNDWMAGFVED